MPGASGIESRRAALRVLDQVREGKPLDSALERGIGELPDADRRLAHELAAGVLRQRTALDRQLAPLVPRGWTSVSPRLQDVLRLGAYQITNLQRVPSHAAVDTSVALAKVVGGARAGGFVNAVLRRLGRLETTAPAPADDIQGLAQQYSHPVWLVRRWVETFGMIDTQRLVQWNNTRPRLVLQPARSELSELMERWTAAGVPAELAPFGAGILTDRRRPAELPGYSEGAFIVQDPAQASLARYADFPPDSTIYDACAAPGGKSIALGRSAKMIVAADVNRIRARRLVENMARAGSGREHVVVADARQPPLRSVAAVLLDAPCLATGTFARHPDARWRVTPEALTSLQGLQAQLLNALASLIEPDGLLVYSTCSLEPEENQMQVDRFLDRHPEFRRDPPVGTPGALLSDRGDLLILPQRHGMDGAYAARLRRAA
jgi:16S rRNA (cytosine967-C5)-methyltransferase